MCDGIDVRGESALGLRECKGVCEGVRFDGGVKLLGGVDGEEVCEETGGVGRGHGGAGECGHCTG
jgi:hypothetical protein